MTDTTENLFLDTLRTPELREALSREIRDLLGLALDDVLKRDARRLLKDVLETLLRETLPPAQGQTGNNGSLRFAQSLAQAGGDVLKSLGQAQRNS